jgi:5-formyltetrahydrofolate cyclo-ligase
MRKQGIDARRSLGVDNRAARSANIKSKFVNSKYFWRANSIACYLPAHAEVDTTGIIRCALSAGKQVYLPVVHRRQKMQFVKITRNSQLKKGAFGLWEPADDCETSPLQLDVVVVPLTAFDRNGNRIGMGGGYYDRAFAVLRNRKAWLHPKLVGVAFACQEVEKIKANPWDIRLCSIITEEN